MNRKGFQQNRVSLLETRNAVEVEYMEVLSWLIYCHIVLAHDGNLISLHSRCSSSDFCNLKCFNLSPINTQHKKEECSGSGSAWKQLSSSVQLLSWFIHCHIAPSYDGKLKSLHSTYNSSGHRFRPTFKKLMLGQLKPNV